MTNAYKVFKGDKVLLVGEGNFSFSKDFLILNKEGLANQVGVKEIEIVSTCKESILETFSNLKKEVINFLVDKGKLCLSLFLSLL